MDFARIPVEILDQILSNLSFEALLGASLVCHRWKHVADRIIVLRGNFRIDLKAVEYGKRNYQSFVLRNPFHRSYLKDASQQWESEEDELQDLQPALETFIRKFKTTRGLKLVALSEYHGYQLFEMFRSWFESLESLDIECFADQQEFEIANDKKHTIEFPNLKQLRWVWNYSLFQKYLPLTMIAPNLETVELSVDSVSVKILHCDKLKRIEYKPARMIPFSDIFVGKFPNLISLRVRLPTYDYDLPLLDKMKALQWLQIINVYYDVQTRVLDELYKCNELLGLKLVMHVPGNDRNRLDLKRLLNGLPKLRQLHLQAVNLQMSDTVRHQNLLQFKMNEDVTIRDPLRFSAPSLEMLILPAKQLQKLHLPDSVRLKQLHLYTDDFGGLKRTLESDVRPFLLAHSGVKDLIVLNSRSVRSVIDQSTYDGIHLDVERLELRDFTVSLKFFRQLTQWNSLRHLCLVACTIDCGEDATNDVVDLPRLETMQIDGVYLVEPVIPRTTFPLNAERTGEVVLEDCSYRSKDLHRRLWTCDCDSSCRFDILRGSLGFDQLGQVFRNVSSIQ